MPNNLLIAIMLFQIESANGKICFDYVCIPQNYSKSTKPLPFVKVFMNFESIQVLEIDDSKSAIELYLYMEYRWQEPRIIGSTMGPEYMPLGKEFLDLLWSPDFYFEGQQKVENQFFIRGGVSSESIWLVSDNFVVLDLGLRTFVFCKMRFESYPFDSHECYLRIGSWSHTDANLQIETG